MGVVRFCLTWWGKSQPNNSSERISFPVALDDRPIMSSGSPTSLVFMGSDPIAIPSLEFLWSRQEEVGLRAVYTQPDRPQGRGGRVRPTRVKAWAMARGIDVYQPVSFAQRDIQRLTALNPDLIVVMAYGHVLPQPVLDVPRLGIFNLHASLLPKLRGASAVETAIVYGEKMTGVSLMRMVLKLDAGPVIDQEAIAIHEADTGGSLRKTLSEVGLVILKRNLEGLMAGNLPELPQSEEEVTYCRLMVKSDGQLNFAEPARALARRIMGLNPWPGCFARIGPVILKMGHASHRDESAQGRFGEILALSSEGLELATGDGVLIVKSLQRPGGKLLPVNEFARGFPLQVGDRFESAEMHPLVSKKPISQKRVFQLYKKTL